MLKAVKQAELPALGLKKDATKDGRCEKKNRGKSCNGRLVLRPDEQFGDEGRYGPPECERCETVYPCAPTRNLPKVAAKKKAANK